VISALTGEGTRELSYAIMDYLEATRARAEAEAAKPDVPAGNGLIRPSTDPVA
jgi:GTP-binding protein